MYKPIGVCILKFVKKIIYILQPATRIPLQSNHTETPTHIDQE